MAGDIKRQRKSWTLQDRSKVSINILRANLAEEGDEDAQLEVAKRLLEESLNPEVAERTQNENARLALYWLIKSSEQGNDEATQLLEECLRSGRGLTAQNILDVQTCVTTPKYEKLTFKAARLLYRKLSNGEEFITTPQLLARTKMHRKNVTFEQCRKRLIAKEEVLPNKENNAELSEKKHENDLVENEENSNDAIPQEQEEFPPKKNVDLNETFVVASHGKRDSSSLKENQEKLPRKTSSPQKSPPSPELYSDLQFAMTQSGKKLTLSDLLNVAKDLNRGVQPRVSLDESNKVLPRHKWKLTSFSNIFVLQFLVLAVLGNVMPATNALSYLLLFGILGSSYNFLLWKRRFKNFEDWKMAFHNVLKKNSWETGTMHRRLSQRYLIPYLILVWSGSVVLSLGMSDDQSMFSSTCVGVTALISIHVGILQRVLPTLRQAFVFAVAVVFYYYKSPLFTDLFGETFSESVIFLHQPVIMGQGDHIALPVNGFHLLIALILVTKMKLSLHRILSETIPEVVQCIWLVKLVQSSVEQDCPTFISGLCVGLVVCIIMGLFSSKMKIWKIVLTVLAGGFAFILAVNAIAINSEIPVVEQGEEKFLDWEDYEMTCHRKAWNVQTPAATQIKCTSLYGDEYNPARVKWKGRISTVKVEQLEHTWSGITGFSDVVFDISVGIFPSQKDSVSGNWQNFLSASIDGDSLAPASVIVKTSDTWDSKKKQDIVDHILNLRTGDKVEFSGELKASTAGSLAPRITHVHSIQCLSCATADYGEFVIGGQKKFTMKWTQILWHFQKSNEIFSNYFKTLCNTLVMSLKDISLPD